MRLAQARGAALHDEERAAAPPGIRIQPQLLQRDVVHDADLGVDVHLAPHGAQGGHEGGRVAVHADPRAVEEDFGGARQRGRRHLLQALHGPFVEKIEHGGLGAPDGDVGHQGQVFDEPARLPLGRLRRAHHAPLRVVQLARLGQLALAPDGGVDAAQVGERGRERQAVEDLGDAGAHVGRALGAPVAGGDGIPQPPRDRVLRNRRPQVGLPPFVQ